MQRNLQIFASVIGNIVDDESSSVNALGGELVKKLFVFILLFQIIVFTGCSDNTSQKSKDINSSVKELISDTYINEIRYSNEDIEEIKTIARKCGIKNPFVPTRGVGTDYVMEIKEKEKSIKIVFPHFSITQSTENLIPNENIEEERNVELSIGKAKWVKVQNCTPVLYIKIDNIYISVGTAKSFRENDFENIMESLVPLMNVVR